MHIFLIAFLVIYSIIGLLVGAFSGLIWGTTKSWGNFSLPNFAIYGAMLLSGVLWPVFVVWGKARGGFNTGIFT